MIKSIILISVLLGLTGCIQDEPKPNRECIKIDCTSIIAFYPIGASVAEQYITQLQYVKCCGKEPIKIAPDKFPIN